jgi:hypothetical protein
MALGTSSAGDDGNQKLVSMWLKHVKTVINHHKPSPVLTIDRWYGYHSQSWLVYDIVLTTLKPISGEKRRELI